MPLFGTPGEQIGYTLFPRAGAPPLVLVHGFTASSASFAANVPALNERFEVVSVELLGHGESDAPEAAAPYAPDAAIARILALLDHLGHEKVLLCGHSLGAALSLRLALDAPQRLAGLILINSMSAAGAPEWREDARPGMVTMAGRLRAEGSGFLRQTRLYPAHSKRLDAESRALLMRAFDAAKPAGLAGTAEALVIDVNSFERLGELSVPTLVVVGDRDKPFAEAAPAFIGRMPAGLVREVHLAEAGHAANIEQPREFEAALAAFAEEVGYLAPATAPPAVAADAGGGGSKLTALGGALVVGGLALLAGAFFVARGNGDSAPVAASAVLAGDSTPRAPTAVSLVAGTRSAGPGAVAAASVTDTPLPAGASATPTQAPQPTAPPPTATAIPPALAAAPPTPTPTPEPTATAVPPTATATTPPATATPSGPRVSISGPGAASVGSPVSFVGSGTGGTTIGQPRWTAGAGSISTANPYAPVVTFSQRGCQVVTVTFIFAGNVQKTAAMNVAVGGASC